MTLQRIDNIAVGEILKDEFMAPAGLSGNALAKKIGVSANRINGIINGSRSITADTAILLGRLFKTSPKFWLNLQMLYDLEEVEKKLNKVA